MTNLTTYQDNPTQEQRIIDLLRNRGSEGVDVWEFMLPRPKGGLGIAQYNARIWGLRQKGFVIENNPIGHFILKFDPEIQKEGQLTIDTNEEINPVRF